MTQPASAPKSPVAPYRIVVGMDFDATGEEALREALRLSALRTDVELHVAHVLHTTGRTARSPEGLTDLSTNLAKGPEYLRDHLLALASRMPAAGARSIRLHVRTGDAPEALHQLAVDVDADLIVVGTHGRKGLARLTLGSTASRLVERAHCPVLVARPKQYEGLAVTETPEAPCAECAKVRTATGGQQTLCPEHEAASLHFQPYTLSHVFTFGEHMTGAIV